MSTRRCRTTSPRNAPSGRRCRGSGARTGWRTATRPAGFTLRMPSATSIKAFDRETGGTFDVPVSARDAAGRTVSGWVRVTHHRGGWASTPVGDFGPRTGAQVAESVAAVLEARRPSRALNEVGDLLARRRERQRVQGVPVSAVKSTFIAGVGYDKATGTMAVAMTGGRLYGYQVPPEVHRAVAESTSPGGAYNALVKGTGRAGIARCERCGRFYPDTAGAQLPGAAHAAARHDAQRPGPGGRGMRCPAVRSASAAPGGVAPATRTAATARSTPAAIPERPALAACCGRRGGRPVSVQHHGEPGRTGRARPLRAATNSCPSNGSRAGNTPGGPRRSGSPPRWPDTPPATRARAASRRPTATTGWCTSPAPVPTSPATPTPSTHPAHSTPGTATPPPCGTCWPPPPATPGGSNSAATSSARDRDDERIVADRVYLFTDAPTGADAWRQAQDDYGILGATAPPDDIRLVDVPWRPGEKAWLLRWE